MTELVISQPPVRSEGATTAHNPAVGPAFLPWLAQVQQPAMAAGPHQVGPHQVGPHAVGPETAGPAAAGLASQHSAALLEGATAFGVGRETIARPNSAMSVAFAAVTANPLTTAATVGPISDTTATLQLLLRHQAASTTSDRLINPLLMSSIGQYRLAQLQAGAALPAPVATLTRGSTSVAARLFEAPMPFSAAVVTPLTANSLGSGSVEVALKPSRPEARGNSPVISGHSAREDWRAPLAQQHWSMRLRADGWHVRIRDYVTDLATSWRAWTPLSNLVIQSITINGTQVLGGADGYHRRWSAGQ